MHITSRRLILAILFIFCLSFQASAWNPMVVVSGTSSSIGCAYSDNFTGTSGAPNAALWGETDTGGGNQMKILSNKLNFDSLSTTADCLGAIESQWYWSVGDNFDITVEFDSVVIAQPDDASSNVAVQISVYPGSGTGWTEYCGIGRARNATYDGYAIKGTSDSETYDETYQDTSGKLRIQKVGSTIKAWYWDSVDGRWEWNTSTDGFTFTDAATENIHVYINWRHRATSAATTVSGNADNFEVVSGCSDIN